MLSVNGLANQKKIFATIGTKRTGSESATNRIVPELLAQLQGFNDNNNNLLVIAATNIPWNIDSALMRPGRFDERLYIPLPDEKARKFLFEKNLENVPLADDIDINVLIEKTEGYNGSDIVELCEVCKNMPIERGIEKGSIDNEYITQDDIDYALEKVHSSVQLSDIRKLEEFQKELI